MVTPPRSRRSEYAEATRQAIVEAARALFAQQGYFATTVEEIARRARVAPATVYAVTGGKQGLMSTLIDVWTTAPVVAATLERQNTMSDPHEILRNAAGAVRAMREEFGDIMRMVLAAAPHQPEAARGLALATERYRAALVALAQRLDETGGLADGVTVPQATDILWFYLGYSGYFTLVDDNRWSFGQAQEWLTAQAWAALRGPRHAAVLPAVGE